MKLIVGLGNPGEKYCQNRHNVGFMFVDYVLNRAPLPSPSFKYDKYLFSEYVQLPSGIILAKPHTFMNKSGDAVRKLLERFVSLSSPWDLSDLIVVHDDLDIPLGKFKIQKQGPKQHNGLISIQNKLRSDDFLRIRIGVDARTPQIPIPGEEYVLSDFLASEKESCAATFSQIVDRFSVEIAPLI